MKPPAAPSRNPLTLKERVKVPRQAVPEPDAVPRSSRSFSRRRYRHRERHGNLRDGRKARGEIHS